MYASIPDDGERDLPLRALVARRDRAPLIAEGTRRRLRPLLGSVVLSCAVIAVVSGGFPTFAGFLPAATSAEFAAAVGTHNSDPNATYTEREAYEILQHHNGTLSCDEVTYAYCGSATCRLSGDGLTANCGCQKIENASGTFHFQSGNSYLATSHIFRNVLFEWMQGDIPGAREMLCGSLKAGTFWRSMGYSGAYGSFSYGSGGATDMWHYNKDVNCDLSKEYNFAYAMGAPCSWDTPYNDRYSVTCTVPYKIASGMGQIVKFPQMTNITSADCGEILAEKEACAIQKTFTEGTVMQNYTEMRKFNTALHAATYTAYGGDECPTV